MDFYERTAVKRLLLICGMAALLSVPVASAGRSVPTLAANPNPVTVGGTVQWTGCGYRAGALLWLQVYQADGSTQPGGSEYESADSSGCFASPFWTVGDWAAGTVVASVYDASNTGGRPKGKELASVTVQVVGATP